MSCSAALSCWLKRQTDTKPAVQEAPVVSSLQETLREGDEVEEEEEPGEVHDVTGEAPSVAWTLDREEVDQLFWLHNTESVLFPQDQAAWGGGFLLLCFIVNAMGTDPAYVVCFLQMVSQLIWMTRFPASYKANRDNICLGIRIWRIYVNSRLCTRFCWTQAAKPFARSLFIASGALVNLVVSVGYQLKLSVHVKLQLVALAVSLLTGTAKVTAFMNQPEHRAAAARIYATLSDAAAFLLEGVNFPGHRKLGYQPDAGLVVVVMVQVYVGFLLPTYALHALERAARARFRSQLQSLAACGHSRAPPQPLATTPVDTFYVALFTLLTHALVLALSGAALWELLCCSSGLLARALLPAPGQLPPALLAPNGTAAIPSSP